MIITRKGFAIALFQDNPRIPTEGMAGLFGPTISTGVALTSENLCSNGVKLFTKRSQAVGPARDRSRLWQKRDPSFRTQVVRVELRIAETVADWPKLRSFRSYIASCGPTLTDCDFYGRAFVRGKRVPGAFDARAPFPSNGFSPFHSYKRMTGEPGGGGLGILSELSRQTQERVWLIGIRIKWPKKRKGSRRRRP